MKGNKIFINGDNWVIVDVAPAPELAEMVAVILEDEGFAVLSRSADGSSDVFTHMGSATIGTTYVLVPEQDEEAALKLIAETVTDYEGEDLDTLLEQLALEGNAGELNGPDDTETLN